MTIHELLQNIMDISCDIDVAAQSLGMSDYCPSHGCCGDDCTECWRAWLEKEADKDVDA